MTAQKLTKNIVLVGLMGSGKTMIAQALAEKLKIKQFSTDAMIVAKEKRPITEVVEAKDWPYFRALEKEVVQTLSRKKGIIIDCGGGVVLDPENIEYLKKNGILFHLKADPEVLYERLKGDQTRPLIKGPNPKARLKTIFKERLPLYNQADFTIDVSGSSIQETIVEILKKVS